MFIYVFLCFNCAYYKIIAYLFNSDFKKYINIYFVMLKNVSQ